MSDAKAPSPKFRRRAEHRPDEVLDAALALFVENGYAHTSVAQIARAAGISKGAVYLYFPSKQAILEGLVKRAVQPVSARALEALPHVPGNTRAALATVMHLIAERMADPQVIAVPRIVLREAAAVPEIAEMFEVRKAEHEGTIEVQVTAAFPLNAAQTAQLEESLKRKLGRDIRITSEQDPELIGGLRLRAGDLVIDGSVTGQLEQLANELGI